MFLLFAKKASAFNSWFENAEEDLTDPVRCNSVEEIRVSFLAQRKTDLSHDIILPLCESSLETRRDHYQAHAAFISKLNCLNQSVCRSKGRVVPKQPATKTVGSSQLLGG